MNAPVIERRHGIRDDVVALTFDDGPSRWTGPILDPLAAHEVTRRSSRSAAPTREASVAAVGIILDAMTERGLRSVTISELLRSG